MWPKAFGTPFDLSEYAEGRTRSREACTIGWVALRHEDAPHAGRRPGKWPLRREDGGMTRSMGWCVLSWSRRGSCSSAPP